MSRIKYPFDINARPIMVSPYSSIDNINGLIRAILLNQNVQSWTWEINTCINGWSPLMIACRNSNTWSSNETVSQLIKMGAHVNYVNTTGQSPLYIAAFFSGTDSSQDTVQMLIDAGANVNVQNHELWTPLMVSTRYATEHSTVKTSQILINAGANVNLQDCQGWTALMLAARHVYSDNVIYLLNAGANLELQELTAGSTALTLIVYISKCRIAECIAEYMLTFVHMGSCLKDLVETVVDYYNFSCSIGIIKIVIDKYHGFATDVGTNPIIN